MTGEAMSSCLSRFDEVGESPRDASRLLEVERNMSRGDGPPLPTDNIMRFKEDMAGGGGGIWNCEVRAGCKKVSEGFRKEIKK